MKLSDAIDPYDRRATDPNELGRIEFLCHCGHRFAVDKLAARCIQKEIIAVRLDPLKLFRVHQHYAAVIFDWNPPEKSV